MKILDFIEALKASDEYIEPIYMQGGCYQFYILLKKLFGDCDCYINVGRDHVVTLHNGKFYDITGEVDGTHYSPLLEEDKSNVESWSFASYHLLQLSECPYCEEPLTF